MRLIAVCPAHLARNLGGREYCSLVLPSLGRKVRNLFPRQRKEKKTSLDLNRDLAEWDEEQHTEAPLQSPQSQRSMAAQVISLGSRRSSEDQMNILKARGADCQNAPRKNKGPFCSLGPPAR